MSSSKVMWVKDDLTQALCHLCPLQTGNPLRAAFKIKISLCNTRQYHKFEIQMCIAGFSRTLPSFISTCRHLNISDVTSMAEARDLAGPNWAVMTSSTDMQAVNLPAGCWPFWIIWELSVWRTQCRRRLCYPPPSSPVFVNRAVCGEDGGGVVLYGIYTVLPPAGHKLSLLQW